MLRCFHLVLLLCERNVPDIEISLMYSYFESGYGLNNDTKISPNIYPSPHFGMKNLRKSRISDGPH